MTAEDVGRFNPQRHEFLQLTSILHYDKEANLVVAHRRVEENEWWSRGHLPGRPLFPGAMMVEMLAQAGSLHSHLSFDFPEGSFIGFTGLDKVRFRGMVSPPEDLWIAGRILQGYPTRHAFRWYGQILRSDATVVCEGVVFGMGF